LRQRLADEKIDAVYSSNLSRALVTAQTIASEHQLEVIACPELSEIDFGKFEGLSFAEVSQLYPDVARLWAERNSGLEFPGGESLDGFDKRVSQFLNRLEKCSSEGTILVVAHSGSLRVLVCRLLGIGVQHRWRFRLDLASLSILDTYPQGGILVLLNDVSHLR
jgi:broad specificity phosphatase PhoE